MKLLPLLSSLPDIESPVLTWLSILLSQLISWASSTALQRKSSSPKALMSSSSVGVSWRRLIGWRPLRPTKQRAGRLTLRDWVGLANRSSASLQSFLVQIHRPPGLSVLFLDFLGTNLWAYDHLHRNVCRCASAQHTPALSGCHVNLGAAGNPTGELNVLFSFCPAPESFFTANYDGLRA